MECVFSGMRPKPRENVILHVGAIQKRKNISRLGPGVRKRSARGWSSSWRALTGFGAEEILKRMRPVRRANRISVLGYVNAEALTDWYARATMLAFPSLDEGFGIPILEAMASGVPVITSNRSAPAEVAGGRPRSW
jgi:glycosyltransferase involved in cell wall biosynthesis